MKLNLSTVSNFYIKSFVSSSEKKICKRTLKIQQKVLGTFKKFNLSKPIDGICQRVWKVLPTVSFLFYTVIALIFPVFKTNLTEPFHVVNLLKKIKDFPGEMQFNAKELEIVMCFFKKAQSNPFFLQSLCAFAKKDEYDFLVFLQGILNTIEINFLQNKLKEIENGITIPLTVEEIGMIELSEDRYCFLEKLHKQNIKEIDDLFIFWSQMVDLQNHPVICALREKTLALFGEECFGFITSYEDERRVKLNLKEESLRSVPFSSRIYYLLVGNINHAGFVFAKEKQLFISDVVLYHPLGFVDMVKPQKMKILYPHFYLYRFTIKPLLSSEVKSEHADLLQKFFSQKLKERISSPQNVKWDWLVGLSAFVLGIRTPFWDAKKVIQLQSKEICTGFTAKNVYQAFLKTKNKLQELGYSQDKIQSPFLPHEHMGRLLVADFIKHFRKKGMIEFVEDPFLKACIEPGFLQAELDALF